MTEISFLVKDTETNLLLTSILTSILVLISLLTVLNCVRLLTRILAYIFEDPDWRGFFWSTLPGHSAEDGGEVTI